MDTGKSLKGEALSNEMFNNWPIGTTYRLLFVLSWEGKIMEDLTRNYVMGQSDNGRSICWMGKHGKVGTLRIKLHLRHNNKARPLLRDLTLIKERYGSLISRANSWTC